nr:hypothetical protein [Tanacetum cinerariifolium]
MDESTEQRFIGVVTGVGDMDPYEWDMLADENVSRAVIELDDAIEQEEEISNGQKNDHQGISNLKRESWAKHGFGLKRVICNSGWDSRVVIQKLCSHFL